jgi:predicted ATPase/class 3 adenylate cyclase
MTPSGELPTGIVTFLFTDIEKSTQLLQALGKRYGDLLDAHNSLLREAFAAHNGIEVSTEGDAFFVVFTNPSESIEAAAQGQRALYDYAEREALELRVRMGLHTGEGLLVGDNYGGIDVHRTARVASAAHGGQVLVSDSTRALAETLLSAGISLRDLGEHELKDLDRPEHLYQLCIEGLPSDFPAPRTLTSRPNNLPVTLTSFVAREREVKEILRLLETNRLVTLTGPGGTGKTRLALEVASKALLDFDDGAFAVFLAPVADPDLVPSSIASALGTKEQGTRPIADILKESLADKHRLLVLDNFEQVVPAAPFVLELLAAPGIKVLVTSRMALRVSSEQEYPVPPMTLPDPRHLPSVDSLFDYEAMALFSERARAVRPDFQITEQNAAMVAEICWRLDGLPLAIELAAARVRLLSLREMKERLHRGLRILTGGARDLPARQQTLRNAIAWSHDLLDEPLRAFYRRLAVFAESWTPEAAEAICNPNAELGIDTLDALEGLSESNLIRRFETIQGETRFRMLQTIREYALELFDSTEEAEKIRRRHATFFLDFAEDRSPRFTVDRESNRQAELEHDNIRAVFMWAYERKEPEWGLRLGSALWRFWTIRSHLSEGRRWLTEFIRLPASDLEPSIRANAVMALGSITYWQNDFEATRTYYLEALEIFRGIDDRPGLAEALYNAGFVLLVERDAAGARPYYEQSRAIAAELGDEKRLANTAWGLAMCALREREWEEARRLAEEALQRYSATNDWFGETNAQFVFFQIARFTGNRVEAYGILHQWLEEYDDILFTLSALELLASLESVDGRHEMAVKLVAAADGLKEEYGGGSPPPLLDIDDPLPAARAALGEDRVDELWNEGRTLSLDEAVAYARKLVTSQD